MTEAEMRKLSDDDLYRRNSTASIGSVERDALSGETARRNSIAQKAGQRNFALLTLALVFVGLAQAAATYAAVQHTPSPAVAPVEQTRTLSKTELFNLKVKCAEVGKQYAEALKKGAEHTGQSATQPRFAYNAELNTCIIRAGYLDLKAGSLYQFLADSLTEETLLEVFGNNPAKQAEFRQAETRLMGPPASDNLKVK